MTITQLNELPGAEALEATRQMDEHPVSYEGICECRTCKSYMCDDVEA